jgi:hypothetical protein
MRSQTTTAERERWIAPVVLCAGFLMIILDGSIVNVGLTVCVLAPRRRP